MFPDLIKVFYLALRQITNKSSKNVVFVDFAYTSKTAKSVIIKKKIEKICG